MRCWCCAASKATFPSLTDFGGVHPDPLPDHPSGRAVDIMIPNYQTAEGTAFGWQVAHWLQDNQQALGVQYVIFDAKIWNVARDARRLAGLQPRLHRLGQRLLPAPQPRPRHRLRQRRHRLPSRRRRRQHAWPPGSGRHRWRVATWSAARGPATCPPPVCRTPGRTSRSASARRSAAPTTGTVEVSKDLNGSYGRYIVIRDRADPKVAVYYAHLSVRGVRVGQQVARRSGHRPDRQHRQQQRPAPALRDPHRRQPGQPDAVPGQARSHPVNPRTVTWALGALALVPRPWCWPWSCCSDRQPATDTATSRPRRLLRPATAAATASPTAEATDPAAEGGPSPLPVQRGRGPRRQPGRHPLQPDRRGPP